jgi:hypothetical protein
MRFSDGAFQYAAASRNDLQSRVRFSARAIHVEDRAVAAELHLDGLWRGPLDPDLFADDSKRLPLAVPLDLVLVRRVQLFNEDVVLVGADDRQAPADALVVADVHAKERRLRCPRDVPSRGIQVHDVAQGGIGDLAVRIVGDDGLAGG